MTGISVCSPLFETFFATVLLDGPLFETPFAIVVLDGFLSSIKGLSLMNLLPFPSFFFGLGVTNNAAKPDCVVPTGDDGSLYEGCSFGELIVIKINEIQLSWKQESCQKCKHWQSHFDFLNNAYCFSFLKRNNLLVSSSFFL